MKNWKKLLIIGSIFTGTYAGLEAIAKKTVEKKSIDDDNPYEIVDTKAETVYERKIKPALDKILSFVGLVTFFPLYVLITVAIIVDDPGPVLFTQKRIGKDKHYIRIHKFRTMRLDTPHDVPTHQLQNPEQYITKVGKMLRKTSLDELPQIWDIFRGRMSIIGPRPALWNQEDLVQERDRYGANHIFPGLTGLAQIKGRDELLIPEKAKLDGEYAKHLKQGGLKALFFDVKVFFGTVTAVLRKDGVVEGGTGSLFTGGVVDEIDVGFHEYGHLKHFKINKNRSIRVLIAGAGSYIGEYFVKYCENHYVNITVDTVDMIDSSWREKDFGKFDTVFCVAGIAHADTGRVELSKQKEYYEVNTDLIIETARKAKKEGVSQFILMSSMIVYGDVVPFGQCKLIDEQTIPTPSNFYGDSKWQADKGVRELSDGRFHVAVLRAPMIYGMGSKGNYPILSKMARKLPVFPMVENKRSMLYIENLCEFVGLLALSGEGGVYFPQNAEYGRTSELVKMIADKTEHPIWVTRLFSPAVLILSYVPGKVGKLVNKAFGNIIYEKKLSQYDGLDYQIISLKESIKKTENINAKYDVENQSRRITEYTGRKGLVSIIMPAYNCENFINQAINSVIDQTYTDWELLIVDDYSVDSTARIVQKFSAADERIKYLRNCENLGAAASRNRAVLEANGQYLAFLDSDDVWKKDKLEKQIQFMEKNGHAFSCTSYNKIDEKGEELGKIVLAVTIDYEGILRRCPGNSTVIYDANKLGKFIIPIIKKRNDYVMWLNVMKEAGMLYGLDSVLSSHRIVSNSISSNKASLVKYHWTVYKKIEKIGFIKSIYLVGFWIAKTLFGVS